MEEDLKEHTQMEREKVLASNFGRMEVVVRVSTKMDAETGKELTFILMEALSEGNLKEEESMERALCI